MPAAKSAPVRTTFVLNDDELNGLISTRGRKASDSIYLDEVREAMDNPAVFVKGIYQSGLVGGIRITDTVKASYIEAQLRKAAQQLELGRNDFSVLQREAKISKENPMGFVAFYVRAKKEAEEAAETASE